MSTKIYDIIDTENGVKFHVNRMEDNLLIDDINVKPGIKTVKFDFGDIRFMVAIAGGKSFPDVDTLIIGSKIDNISIPNDLFPNIKRVISYSNKYKNGKYLVSEHNEVKFLLNAFCQDENTTIDLTGINVIENKAFNHCKAKEIINADSVDNIISAAFDNSFFYNKKVLKNQCVVIGHYLLKADETAYRLEIPSNVETTYVNVHLNKVKEVVVHNLKILECILDLPQKLIIAKDTPFFSKISKLKMKGLKYMDVEDGNPFYSSENGVLFTKNKKYLLKFPPGRTGLYKIPEGVNTIDENSFAFSNIEEVIMPSTMRNLKTFAFYNSYLKSIDFGSGLERIGNPHPESGVFSQCGNLKSISFPKQIKSIGAYAFCGSGLEYVSLNDGLKSIDTEAFSGCHINEIVLPATLDDFGSGYLFGISKVVIDKRMSHTSGLSQALTTQHYDNGEKGVQIVQGTKSIYIKRPSWIGSSQYFKSMDTIKKYEEKTFLQLAAMLINNENYVELIKMLNINNYDEEHLREILKLAQSAFDTTAAAYILEKLKETEKNINYEV